MQQQTEHYVGFVLYVRDQCFLVSCLILVLVLVTISISFSENLVQSE